MRVIAGRYRGRRLFALPGDAIRPTINRLKETYFNIVREEIEGARFLDICAGSGSMGIEALSRGAAEVVFVEQSRQALKVLQRNLERCGIDSGYRIVAGDLFHELPRLNAVGERFDLIFFDPPYFRDLYRRTLTLIGKSRLLAPDGILAADHFKKTEIPDTAGRLTRSRMVRQGDSVLSFYLLTPDA